MAHPYELLAELLEYPAPDLLDTAERCRAALAGRGPEVSGALERFAAAVAGKGGHELEEHYARLFDLNPARCLDLGYQIFGETYKRGAFLVKMKGAVDAHGVDAGVELADHLPVVLRLLPRLSPGDDPRELVAEVVLPVVEKVLRTFDDGWRAPDPSPDAAPGQPGGPRAASGLEDDRAGYRALLEAVERVLMIDFGVDRVAPLPTGLDTGSSDASGGRRLPVFPGFHAPSERHSS